MNKLEEEDNKRKTLRKHKEKQETQEGTKLRKLKARRSSRNRLAIVPLVKGSRKNENHKEALDIAGDVYWVLRVCQGVC